MGKKLVGAFLLALSVLLGIVVVYGLNGGMVFGANDNQTIPTGDSKQDVNRTSVLEMEDPTYRPGDILYIEFPVEATGEGFNEFGITMNLETENGVLVNLESAGNSSPPYSAIESVNVTSGEKKLVEMETEIPREAPEGNYTILIDAWYETDPSEMASIAMRREFVNAFRIEKPEGRLVINDVDRETTFILEKYLDSRMKRTRGGEVLDLPVDREIPVGSYRVIGTSSSGTWEKDFEIFESETTELTPEFNNSNME